MASFKNVLPLAVRQYNRSLRSQLRDHLSGPGALSRLPLSAGCGHHTQSLSTPHSRLQLNRHNSFSTSRLLRGDEEESEREELLGQEEGEEGDKPFNHGEFVQKYYDPKDRTRVISVDLSIKYMESLAYRTTYGSDPVWRHYRRNMKGGNLYIPKTRETCIRWGRVETASPCPICRDQYLVVDYRNVALLQQFLDPYSGALIDTFRTGLCQFQWRRLQIHIQKAKDYGLLNVDAPQHEYEDTHLYKL